MIGVVCNEHHVSAWSSDAKSVSPSQGYAVEALASIGPARYHGRIAGSYASIRSRTVSSGSMA